MLPDKGGNRLNPFVINNNGRRVMPITTITTVAASGSSVAESYRSTDSSTRPSVTFTGSLLEERMDDVRAPIIHSRTHVADETRRHVDDVRWWEGSVTPLEFSLFLQGLNNTDNSL